MLTDTFINLSCGVCLSSSVTFRDSLIRDIRDVLGHENPEKIPVASRQKFELAKTICKLRLADKDRDEIVDSIRIAGNFKELDSYLEVLSKFEIPIEKSDGAISQIRTRKKHSNLLKDFPKFEEFIDKLNTHGFNDLDDAIKEWEHLVSRMHGRMSDEQRNEANSNIETLDLLQDDFKDVIQQIETSYSGKNSVSTGVGVLDEYMNGGFEPSRLYVFGGSSGDGKSTLLLNLLKNAAQRTKTFEEEQDPRTDIYVYFTMENLVDESLTRLYCSLTEQSIQDVMKKYQTEKTLIESYIKNWMKQHNSSIQIIYLPPTTTSVSDIFTYLDDIKTRYKGAGVIRAIYIDYLDLLRSGQTFDIHRLEMGQVTLDLKVLAVRLNTPVVTVTQLNRGGYDHSENLSLVQMSESIKKVEHADFVGLIRAAVDENKQKKDMNDGSLAGESNQYGIMTMVVAKNRSGPKNKVIKLQTNFSTFQIMDSCIQSTTTLPFREEISLPNQLL